MNNEADSTAVADLIARAWPRLKALQEPLAAYAAELPAREARELRSVIKCLHEDYQAAAAEGFRDQPTWWIPLTTAAVREDSSTAALGRFIAESRAARHAAAHWWWKLAYPAAIALLAIAVLIVLGITIVPQFKSIFQEFGLQLPWPTQLSIAFSDGARSGVLWLVLAGIVLAGGLLLSGVRWLRTQAWFAPVARFFTLRYGGSLARGRVARTLAQLLAAGVPLASAWRIAGQVSERLRMRLATSAAAEGESAYGERLSLGPATYFAVTEQMPSTTRTRLLEELSACYADRVSRSGHAAHAWIGPAATIAVGMVVGWVVLSLFLPLVKLIEGLS